MKRWILLAACLLAPSVAGATHWFVDHTASGANDGTSTTDAWTAIKSAVENDYATSHNYVHVRSTHRETITEDIRWDGWEQIYVVGDDGTWWPGDDDKASFNTGGYRFESYGAHGNYSSFENVCIQEGTGGGSGYGCIYIYQDPHFRIANIDFSVQQSAGRNKSYFIYLTGGCALSPIESCTFTNEYDPPNMYAVAVVNTDVSLLHCTLDGLAAPVSQGTGDNHQIYMLGCDIGQNIACTYDASFNGYIVNHYMQECLFNGSDPAINRNGSYYTMVQKLYWTERDESNRLVSIYESGHNRREATYGTARSGGGDYSIGFRGTATMSSIYTVLEYFIEADSAESRDYTIYANRAASWGNVPALEEVYMQIDYQSGGGYVSATASTSLANTGTWYGFTAAGIAPDKNGPVYVRVIVNETDTDGWLYFDPVLVTSTDETYEPKVDWAEPTVQWVAPEEEAAGNSQIILIGADQRRPPDWYHAWRRAGQ